MRPLPSGTASSHVLIGAFSTRFSSVGGTVADMPLTLQPKLLRVLEAREVKRIGQVQGRKVDVRVIAATNRDLREEVNRGTFRQDLYYRLEVVRLRIPPLRERPEDVPALIEHFRRSVRPGAEMPPLSDEVLQHFCNHPWPGNVRELRNAVERAVVLQELPAFPQAAPADEPEGGSDAIDVQVPFKDAKNALTERFERRYLTALLRSTGNNVSEAARRAGIDRVYLLKLLMRYGLRERPETP